MFDLDRLSKLRFGMSEVPKVGGQPGTYEEKWGQWFLERSFFRDLVYRNPRGKKKGQELADAVVLFDDVVLMVQVKAQCGRQTQRLGQQKNCWKLLSSSPKRIRISSRGTSRSLKMTFTGRLNSTQSFIPTGSA